MKAEFRKVLVGILFCLCFVGIYQMDVFAANASVSVSSQDVSEGETVDVKVTISGDDVIQDAKVSFTYDDSILTLESRDYVTGISGKGKLSISGNFGEDGKNGTYSITFTAKKEGTSEIAVDVADTVITASNPAGAAMEVTATNGTVSVKAPQDNSVNSRLSGLSVHAVNQDGTTVPVMLTPAFSSDILEYKTNLSETVVKLIVSTNQPNPQAKTKVSGTRMDPGDNLTTITVTAQNGSKSVYKIYSQKAVAETPADATEPPQEETNPDQQTEEQPQTEPTADIDRTPIKIENLSKFIIQDMSLVTMPEGFEESTAVFNGINVVALKGTVKKLTLLCLADDEQGTNLAFYILNEENSSLSKMVNITIGQKVYTILPMPEKPDLPEKYVKTSTEIGGDQVEAYHKDNSDYYIVNAMNYEGDTGLYIYDSREQTMQRYARGTSDGTNSDSSMNIKNMVIIILVIICCVLVVACILAIKKSRIYKNEDEEYDDDEEYEDEEDDDDEEYEDEEYQNDKDVEQLNNKKEEQDTDKENKQKNDKTIKEDKESEKSISQSVTDNEWKNEDGTQINDKENRDTGKQNDQYSNNKNLSNFQQTNKKDGEENLINMEDDEPFEIEFVDLEDNDKN